MPRYVVHLRCGNETTWTRVEAKSRDVAGRNARCLYAEHPRWVKAVVVEVARLPASEDMAMGVELSRAIGVR